MTENFVVDVMHDVLEGIAHFELSLILNALANDKSVGLTLNHVNSTLTYFDYLSMCGQDHVSVADWISVGHYAFKPNVVTVNAIVGGIPKFGIVVHINNVKKSSISLKNYWKPCIMTNTFMHMN